MPAARATRPKTRPLDVVRLRELCSADVQRLSARYGVALQCLGDAAALSHSFWGAPEAGISHAGVQLRPDTPAHSLLHELCHIVCMTAERRAALQRDAGGDVAEECAVCYLQVLLADRLPGFGAARCLRDMDAWGYSFREGSAAAWFDGDGRAARSWLCSHGLIDAAGKPTWRLRR